MHLPFEPTPEQRRMARTMSGLGLPQEQIALLLEIDPKTLRKHFRDDLDRGMAEANVKVGQSLFNMATTGNNVAAAIFWMKARAGWREKQEAPTENTEWYIEGVPEAASEEEWVRNAQSRRQAQAAALSAPVKPPVTPDMP